MEECNKAAALLEKAGFDTTLLKRPRESLAALPATSTSTRKRRKMESKSFERPPPLFLASPPPFQSGGINSKKAESHRNYLIAQQAVAQARCAHDTSNNILENTTSHLEILRKEHQMIVSTITLREQKIKKTESKFRLIQKDLQDQNNSLVEARECEDKMSKEILCVERREEVEEQATMETWDIFEEKKIIAMIRKFIRERFDQGGVSTVLSSRSLTVCSHALRDHLPVLLREGFCASLDEIAWMGIEELKSYFATLITGGHRNGEEFKTMMQMDNYQWEIRVPTEETKAIYEKRKWFKNTLARVFDFYPPENWLTATGELNSLETSRG